MKRNRRQNLFLEEHDEELEGEVHEIPRVESMPEREEEQRDDLGQLLAAEEPQSLEHVPSHTHTAQSLM